jgi:hypothetical protein
MGTATTTVNQTTTELNQNIAMMEPESAETIFLEHMEDAPIQTQQLIENIRAHYAERGDIEIHFKRRSPADLRVRVCNGVRLGRNVFTIQWKPRLKEFLCMSLATSLQGNPEGIYSKPTLEGEPLNTQFRLSGHINNKDTLIKLINAAIAAY